RLIALSSLGSTVVGIKGYFDPGTRPRPLPPIARPPTATKYGRALARRGPPRGRWPGTGCAARSTPRSRVPIAVACSALGLEPAALADAVRRQATHGRQHERTATNAASEGGTHATARGDRPHRRPPPPARARHQA